MCGCECRTESQATRAAGDPRFSTLWQEPTRSERKAVLEAFQKRLEERLAEVKGPALQALAGDAADHHLRDQRLMG
jgi:hypothetical protein